MRITNKAELEALIKQGRLSGDVIPKARAAVKGKKTRIADHKVCPVVPSNPHALLYHHLVRRYGRFASGGEVVFELCFAPLGRKWRLDIAMPRFKWGFELDGWGGHGRMRQSFLRDREKTLWLAVRGWHVLRFSANQVRDELNDVLLAIEQVVTFASCNTDDNWRINRVAFDRSEYNHDQS